jgi:hypothetical protein
MLTRKTEDILACLRGAVSGGAEKNKESCTSWGFFSPLALEMILIIFTSFISNTQVS